MIEIQEQYEKDGRVFEWSTQKFKLCIEYVLDDRVEVQTAYEDQSRRARQLQQGNRDSSDRIPLSGINLALA